jgi:head-tail adaptor
VIQSGQLDERIELYRPTVASISATGADVAGTPTLLRTVWAAVEYMQGRELQAASQRWAEARYKITIRRQPGITLALTDYISWNSQTLDMLDIRGPGTRDDFWIILAQDHVN